MELKEKLLDSHLAFEEESEVNETIQSHRSKALRIFEKKGFPTKKVEAWKYTSLAPLVNKDYALFPRNDSGIELKDVKPYFLYEIDTYKVVFIDGVYSPFLSDTTHDGLDVCLLSAALSKKKYKSTIDKYFNKAAVKDESLTSLNTAFAKEGAYIYIPKSKVSEKPIEIIHFSSGEQNSLWLQPRNLIVVEENAQVQIIERHQSLRKHDIVTNVVTEIFAHKDSFVDYYKIQNDLNSASLIDNTYIVQEKKQSC
jgi:Fe-S cluster assembly protein SufD